MTSTRGTCSLILAAMLLVGVLPGAAGESRNVEPAPVDHLVGEEMTREELVSLYRSFQPAQYAPPACVPGSEMFNDVPASSPFCPWVEELARRGITAGCSASPPLYCPTDPVTREQMAVFIIAAVEDARDSFAVVDDDGTLVRGRGVLSANRLGTGAYEVFFDRPVGACAYIGNVGMPDISSTDGTITTALRVGTTDGVWVETFNPAGIPSDRPFHLHLLC